MSPAQEAKARETIDELLQAAGWMVVDPEPANLSARRGVAIGPAGEDDLLGHLESEQLVVGRSQRVGQESLLLSAVALQIGLVDPSTGFSCTARKNSFHAKMTQSRAVAARPGATIGRMTDVI